MTYLGATAWETANIYFLKLANLNSWHIVLLACSCWHHLISMEGPGRRDLLQIEETVIQLITWLLLNVLTNLGIA